MPPSSRRFAVVVVAVLGAALACTEEPVSVPIAATTVRVAFNVQQIGSVSTLARVGLSVNRGTVTPSEQPFVYGQGSAEFAVTVPVGEIVFTANVYSNNNVVLYSATNTHNFADDQFQLDMPLSPVNAVMVVFPDTASLLSAASASFTVRNVGVQPLTWTLPTLCDANSCLTLSRSSGTLAPGATDVVAVSGFAMGAQRTNTLRITSNVGHIDLQAVTPVDATPPTLTLGGITVGSTNPQPRTWTFTATDPPPNASGFAANPFRVRIRRTRPGLDGCFVPDNVFTGATAPCTAGNNVSFTNDDGTVGIDASANREGYWEIIGSVSDRAGNASAQVSGLTLLDVTAPTVQTLSSPATLSGNGTHTFVAFEGDNVDLARRAATIRYSGGFDVLAGIRTTGAYGIADGMTGALADTFVVAGFIRAWEATNTANRASGVVNEAQTMLISLSDVALNPQSAGFNINPAVRPIGTAIPPLAVISPTAFASPISSHSAFVQSVPTATTVCRSTVACINPASTILRVTMNGASGTFVNPFQRVVFYYLDAAVGWWVLIGSSATPTVTDTGNERIYSYSLFWNVTGLMTTGGQPLLGTVAVRAVGVHASGSALVSTNTQRTITFLNN